MIYLPFLRFIVFSRRGCGELGEHIAEPVWTDFSALRWLSWLGGLSRFRGLGCLL